MKKFTPTSPDRYTTGPNGAVAKLGHLNEIVEHINTIEKKGLVPATIPGWAADFNSFEEGTTLIQETESYYTLTGTFTVTGNTIARSGYMLRIDEIFPLAIDQTCIGLFNLQYPSTWSDLVNVSTEYNYSLVPDKGSLFITFYFASPIDSNSELTFSYQIIALK